MVGDLKDNMPEAIPAEFIESTRFKDMAAKIISLHVRVGHVEMDNVLFVEEINTEPKALAACFRLSAHPVKLFTNKNFCIVVYMQNVDYMTDNQLAILMLHELSHVPFFGDKMVDHNVKDFSEILEEYGVDWAHRGVDVPDILAGDKT